MELEAKDKWGEREESSSTKSLIITKGSMYCLVMLFEEYMKLRGLGCIILEGTLDQLGLSC